MAPPHRLSAVLVSRFLLDLQAANQHALQLGFDDPSSSGLGSASAAASLIFARIDAVGSIGAALPVGEFASWGSSVDTEEAEDKLNAQSE